MTEQEITAIASSEEGLQRFQLAIHRSRAAVFVLTVPCFFLGRLAGVIRAPVAPYLIFFSFALASAVLCHFICARGVDTRLPFPLYRLWLPLDVVLVTISIMLTGGGESPFFLLYLSSAATAAFVRGQRALRFIAAASVIAYLLLLIGMGHITGLDRSLFLPLFRMSILYAASWFFLAGISKIQEKRAEVQQLREEDQRRVDELTRLTAELDRRTRDLGQANVRIREADRAKSQFLANMSHELRTPMNSIIGFTEILLERLQPQIIPRHVDFLNHILTSAHHLLGIINDVLDLSKIEAGKMEIFPERFAVAPIIHGVCKVMKGQNDANRVEFDINLPPDLPLIESDLAKFKQILYNLLSNAAKFSSPGSRVTITGQANPAATPPSLTISITDTGIGIAAENHSTIFEEFRQLDGSAQRARSGTGLGLALVRRFVEMQHGTITVESVLGVGSTFCFTLPLVHQGGHGDLDLVTEERTIDAPGERVLVVEDDPIAFDAISAHLRSAAYIPVRARHGDEALRLARTVQPVAITLDLVLPGLDGWEVLKTLKADPVTAEIPVVVISMVDQRELGIALGAHDYFLKPVDRARLIERVRQFSSPGGMTPMRVLVIDDDAQFHEMVAEEVSSLGYALHKAMDGTEGLQKAIAELPDLIILDLMMPGMSGFEVAEQLKRNPLTAQIPILVMTAKELTVAERLMLQSRVVGLIPKGHSKARLLGAIRQLERSRSRIGTLG